MNSDFRLEAHLDFRSRAGDLTSGSSGRIRVVCGTAGTWVLRLVVLDGELKAGEVLRIARTDLMLAYRFQDSNPRGRDYVTLACSSDADLRLDLAPRSNRLIEICLTKGCLERGAELVLRLGDRRAGSVGSVICGAVSQGRLSFYALQEQQVYAVAQDYRVEVTFSDQPAALRLIGPPVVAPRETVGLHLVVFDLNRNVIETFCEPVVFDLPDGVGGMDGEARFEPAEGGIKIMEGVSFAQPGVYRIGVSLPDRGLQTCSNPIICREGAGARIYWGDLHCHGWGDCTMYQMHD